MPPEKAALAGPVLRFLPKHVPRLIDRTPGASKVVCGIGEQAGPCLALHDAGSVVVIVDVGPIPAAMKARDAT
jgi:hypothetical protein